MVRSLWIRTLATTLVWTGVTWAQQPTSAPDSKKAEEILTIQEKGKSPQKCRVIKTWRTGDGSQAYQVRVLDTGEMLTITEKVSSNSTYGAKPPSVATQIFHWGPGQVSPANAPAPPGTLAAHGVATNANPRAQTGPNAAAPYTQPGTDSVKPVGPSPYSSTNKVASQSDVGTKNISLPEPERDWRQSWAKAEEKPLRIEDKPSTKDSIADAPRLKIEGKTPVKQAPFQPKVVLNPDDPLLHPDQYMPKVLDVTPIRKSADTNAVQLPTGSSPARAPTLADLAGARTEKKSPAALDKPNAAFDASKMPAPALPIIAQPTLVPTLPSALDRPLVSFDAGKMQNLAVPPAPPAISQLALVPTLPLGDSPIAVVDANKSPTVALPPTMPVISQPKPSLAPTAAVPSPAIVIDAGMMPGALTPPATPVIRQPKLVPMLPSFEDKPAVVIDNGKMPGPVSIPTLPVIVQPVLGPMPAPALDSPKVVVDVGKKAAPVTIPDFPEISQPAVIPVGPNDEKKSDSAEPANAIGHATTLSTPVIPQVTVQPANPPAPLAVAPQTLSRVPLPPMPETRGERPNFLIMDASSSAASDHSIKLPGVPNAVVAFGQPVTVTSPPPDMVRKKSLEAHSVHTMIGQLKDSLYPSQREWAAEGLTAANWKVHPQVIAALCTAALEDPAPSVRARCAKSLAAMNVRSEAALGAIRKLQTDKDDAVRAEADEAFKVLGTPEMQP